MGLVPNFQPHDVAEALHLLLHMLTVLGDGNTPSPEDRERVRELVDQIRIAK